MKADQIICNVCSTEKFSSRTNKVFGNKLLTCLNCGLVFAQPELTVEDLRALYGKDYFKNDDSHLCGYSDYLKDESNIKKTFEKRIKKINSLRPHKGKILDIGCATGFFLEVARKHGWEPWGVEISEYAAGIAQKEFGERIYTASNLAEADLPLNYFDVITGWDYIEHIQDPGMEISRIFNLLKSDGLLVLSTPDIESLPSKITKDKWMGYKDTEHLYFFSQNTLRNLLQKNNLTVIKKEYVGKHVSLNLFVSRLSLYSKIFAQFTKKIIPNKFLNIGVYINPFDIMCIYAVKSKK